MVNKNFIDKIICQQSGHKWKLTYDKSGVTKDGFPIRDIEYTCQRTGCGMVYKKQLFAFVPGAGALEYIKLPGDKECRRIEK